MFYVTNDVHKSGEGFAVYEGTDFQYAKDIAFRDYYYNKSRYDRRHTLYYELLIFDSREDYENGEEPIEEMSVSADVLDDVEEWI